MLVATIIGDSEMMLPLVSWARMGTWIPEDLGLCGKTLPPRVGSGGAHLSPLLGRTQTSFSPFLNIPVE